MQKRTGRYLYNLQIEFDNNNSFKKKRLICSTFQQALQEMREFLAETTTPDTLVVGLHILCGGPVEEVKVLGE